MEEINPKLISGLSHNLEIDLAAASLDHLKDMVAAHINDLIHNDFDKLVRILYKVDVPEKILKENLQKSKADAGVIIAEMIVGRQLQKIKKQESSKLNDDIPENEKW